MLFEEDQLQLQLLEVLRLEEEAVVMKTRARPFFALSIRTKGDTEIVFPQGERERLVRRDLALFYPNVSYTRYSENDCKYVFHFSVQNQVRRLPTASRIEILHDFHYDTLFPLFSDAWRIWNAQRPGYHVRCTAMLYSIFAEIRENMETERPRYSPLVTEALRLLDEHYTEHDFSVSSLAGLLHISTTYLRNCFLRDLGTAPMAHLNSLRMNRAQALLNTGYYSVSNVADQCGFSDPKNFSTAFRKYYGYPPSAQRYGAFRQADDASGDEE